MFERKKLTWRGKFQREVSKQPLSSDVRNRAENDDGPGEPGVTEPDPLVRGELGHRFTPHKVFPMVLKNRQLIPLQQFKIIYNKYCGNNKHIKFSKEHL